MRTFFYFLLLLLVACDTPPSSQIAPSVAHWGILTIQKKDSLNPILIPDNTQQFFCPVRNNNVGWEAANVFNPAAVLRNDTTYLLYRAQDSSGTSRIGLASSTDGINFTKEATPVLFPGNDAQKVYEWPGGCEDPRVVQDSAGTYYMLYTAYDGKVARLLVATSTNLRTWTKHGLVFERAYNGKYKNFWSKSGAVVCQYQNGTPIAQKIRGKYWMYWGDQNIWLATSDDLISWTPLIDSAAKRTAAELRGIAAKAPELKIAFAPRPKKWDSDLVEPGPPAMLKEQGILLLYNSRNVPSVGDSSLAEGTYTAGQILFDKADPSKVLQRSENYFIKPEKDYELKGAVNRVCFVEGLVQFRQNWFLYYGTADSKIAVAAAAITK